MKTLILLTLISTVAWSTPPQKEIEAEDFLDLPPPSTATTPAPSEETTPESSAPSTPVGSKKPRDWLKELTEAARIVALLAP